MTHERDGVERWSKIVERSFLSLSHLSSGRFCVICWMYLLGESYVVLFLLLSLIFCFLLLLDCLYSYPLVLPISLFLLSLLPFSFLPFCPIIIPQLLISKLYDFQRLIPLAVPLQVYSKPPSSSLYSHYIFQILIC